MGPRSDDETLSLPRSPRRRALAEPFVVPERADEQAVVPAGQVKRRCKEPIVPFRDVIGRPVVVVARMGEHLEVARRVLRELGDVDGVERHVPHPALAHRLALLVAQTDGGVAGDIRMEAPPSDVDRLAEVPSQAIEEIEGAALIHHVVAARVGRAREKRHERLGRERRRGKLGRGRIATAEHAHLAVHVWECREPGDGIAAVGRLVMRPGDAVRGVAPPGILHRHDVTARGEPLEERDLSRRRFRVGRSLEQRREASWGFGAIDVGAQDDAVRHRRLDVLLDANRIGHRRREDERCREAAGSTLHPGDQRFEGGRISSHPNHTGCSSLYHSRIWRSFP